MNVLSSFCLLLFYFLDSTRYYQKKWFDCIPEWLIISKTFLCNVSKIRFFVGFNWFITGVFALFIAKTFSLDGHLRCLFLVFDLFITALLRSLVIKRAWFPRTFFWVACLFKKFWKILVKTEVDTSKAKTCVFDHLER